MVSSKQTLRWVALVVTGFLALASAGHAQRVKTPSFGLFGRFVHTLDAGLAAVRDCVRIGKNAPNGPGGAPPHPGGAPPYPGGGPAGGQNRAGTGVDPSGRQ